MDYSVNRSATPTHTDQIEDDAPSDDDFNYGAAATTAPEGSYFASTSWRSGRSSSDSLSYDAPAISAPETAYLAEDAQRPQMPRSIRDLGQILNSKRRAAVQQTIRGAATAWIDQDDSGTYDPKADRATPPVTPPRRAKKLKLVNEPNKDGNQRPQMTRPHRVGYSLPMTIVLTSEAGLDYLRSITPGPLSSEAGDGLSQSLDPEDGSRHGSFSRRKTRRPRRLGEASTRGDGLTIDQLSFGHPQRRGCRACFDTGDDNCSLITHANDFPCTACDDASIDCELILPPKLKKVCERCKKKRISCSYRKDGGKDVNSCEACEEAYTTCCAGPLKDSSYSRRYDDVLSQPQPRPAVPPRQFVSCNECRMSGSRCSLKNKQQPGPCKHCRESNNECTFVLIPANAVVDIPTSKTKQTGRKKEVSKKPAKRRHQASTPDQNGIDNNFSSPNEQLTYNLGKEYSDRRLGRKGRQTLLPYGDADPSGGRRTKKKEQLLEKGKRISRSKSTNTGDDTAQPMLIRTTAGIQHTFTKTSFCHPIQFNYIPDPLGNFPCSWCSFPFFGFFGHGERTVEIVPWASVNGNGNEEILGGHAAEHPNTKMCVSCTFARIRILSCARHIIRQIKHLDEDTFDEAALGESLIAYDACDQAGGKLALDTKWCAVCRTPAFYECCTPQAFDASGELVPDGQVLHGCGLVLCGECAQFYGKVEKGLRGAVGVDRTSQNWGGGSHAEVSGAEVLSRMVGETKCSLLYDEMGIRADATFLTLSGELMVRMRLGMGQHRGAGAGAGGNGERSEVLELSDSDDEIGDDILGEVLRRNKGRINGGIRGPLLSKEIGKGQGGGHGSGRSGSGNRQGKGPRVLER